MALKKTPVKLFKNHYPVTFKHYNPISNESVLKYHIMRVNSTQSYIMLASLCILLRKHNNIV